jgi:hypothetical protein
VRWLIACTTNKSQVRLVTERAAAAQAVGQRRHVRGEIVNEENRANGSEVVLRPEKGGGWRIESPHAERDGDVFITYASDMSEAIWLAQQMYPGVPIHIAKED